ncbi:hypothetical protein [Vibrio tapetis]|uniref:Hydroxylamine reductase n=1 Tax=Vibrio tapetis subsp. tapetis TaxID=1671868 RepID=A0A2N8Z996_9VIBR|nr:hypothetical protein [Vibrio tapetis]MDN3679266.1 hypothetical protein [Vibrio tapetis subsp. quintayensis]SON48488.1 conserved exported protein of unknown function [Vibrio tapetis subsp. tapetis]
MKRILLTVASLFVGLITLFTGLFMAVFIGIAALITGKRLQSKMQKQQPFNSDSNVIEGDYEDISRK